MSKEELEELEEEVELIVTDNNTCGPEKRDRILNLFGVLPDVSVSSVRKHIANLSEDDRYDFLCDVQEGYCNFCSKDENKYGECYCMKTD